MGVISSQTQEQTRKLGELLGRLSQPGDVVTLTGDLGAGKTTFTKGIAKGLGVHAPVSSPTFTIIKEYTDGRLPLYHFDLYRLAEQAIDEDIGYEEYFYGAGVCVIEWPEFISEILPDDHLQICIACDTGAGEGTEAARTFTFTSNYPRWESVIKELQSLCGI